MIRIARAAIKLSDTGEVFSLPPPNRHHNIITILPRHLKMHDKQGFVTSEGNFVDRRTAKKIAMAAKQLLPRAMKLEELYSEDVW